MTHQSPIKQPSNQQDKRKKKHRRTPFNETRKKEIKSPNHPRHQPIHHPLCISTLNTLKAPPTTTTPPATSTTAHKTACTTSTTVSLLARLVFRLGLVVHQQRIQRQTVRQDVVADRRAADVDRVERDRVAALGGHFDGAQCGVHLRRDGGHRAVEDSSCFPPPIVSWYLLWGDANGRTILQFNRHRLVGAFHEKSIVPDRVSSPFFIVASNCAIDTQSIITDTRTCSAKEQLRI